MVLVYIEQFIHVGNGGIHDVIVAGAFCIKTLLTNKTLEVLDIGGNEIGKPGVAAITEGIQYTTTLEKISIDRCGLSVEGMTCNC